MVYYLNIKLSTTPCLIFSTKIKTYFKLLLKAIKQEVDWSSIASAR